MDYYEYQIGSPNWWIKKVPPTDEKFQKELSRLGGLNTFGEPILKAVWLGTHLSDTSYKPTLAFKKIWHGLTHFEYRDDEGNIKVIHREDDAPKGKLVLPVYQTLELGMLRWGIMKWMSVEDAIRGGRFDPQARSETGERLFSDPPMKGVYNLFFKVETAEGRYKSLDEEVLYAVREMWHYNERTSIDKKVADLLADERREEKESRETARAVWY